MKVLSCQRSLVRLRRYLRLPTLAGGEQGTVLVMAAFAFVGVLALVGLSVDVGKVYLERRSGQNGVDAAALAAAGKIIAGGTTAQAITEGNTWLTKNGQTGAGYTSAVNIPPATGPHAGESGCVEVTSRHSLSGFFTPGLSTKDVAARAVSCLGHEWHKYGIITLNPSVCSALYVNGNVNITITGAGIFDNSNCQSDAFYANGNITIDTEANEVVGNWYVNGNAHVSEPLAHAKPITDPLAGLAVPAPVSAPVQACPNLNGNGSYTFQPGRYNCLLNPNGNWNLTFQAGDYYFRDGINFNGNLTATFNGGIVYVGGSGLRVNGNSNVTANHVMFYIGAGCIDLNGNGVTMITPPSSGTWAGMSIFVARNLSCTVHVNGNASTGSRGTVYAAGALVDYNGNASTNYQFVVNRFNINGNANVTITWDGGVQVDRPKARLSE